MCKQCVYNKTAQLKENNNADRYNQIPLREGSCPGRDESKMDRRSLEGTL